jgi:phage tail-like protein
MARPSPFALIQTDDQWLRCSHIRTALLNGSVQLAWEEEPQLPPAEGEAPTAAGLAFDSHCRLFRTIPEHGRLEQYLWASQNPLQPVAPDPPDEDLLIASEAVTTGEFVAAKPARAYQSPRGIAIDTNDRLFVAESGAKRISVIDLWSRRVLRRIAFSGRPVDVAAGKRRVYALTEAPAGLWVMDARRLPRELPLPGGVTEPGRIALSSSGDVFLLDRAGTAAAHVIGEGEEIAVPWATDIEFLDETPPVLVIAHLAGQDLTRKRIAPGVTTTLAPFKAKGYDGRGIVRTPDGRIGFWTANGFRHAVLARVRFRSEGSLFGFRLDSGAFRTQWGRIFLDACIPSQTSVQVRVLTLDDMPDDEPLVPPALPSNVENASVHRPDLSPPMPPIERIADATSRSLYRRDTGRDLPWVRPAANDPFETYELPAIAPPGRYLWIALDLKGNSHTTPRVRSLRAEYPSHDHLRRLPKLYSRDAEMADFLRRYLAMPDGAIGELESRAGARHALIDPMSAPAEILPWLAGFVGLVLDERWSESARRTAIREAIWLWRFRGTIAGLSRLIAIYLGVDPLLIEKWRMRGVGGIGAEGAPNSNAILGAGFRVGGEIGDPEVSPISGSADDAFDTHAHRFSVMIPAALSQEQFEVVGHILEVHRPAHTMFDVCTASGGMRVGSGLHVGLTAIIGESGGFDQLQLGTTTIGRTAVLGRAQAGFVPAASRLGLDSRVG